MTPLERDYFSYQYSLLIALTAQVISALLFLLAAIYVVADKRKADQYTFPPLLDTQMHSQTSGFNIQRDDNINLNDEKDVF